MTRITPTDISHADDNAAHRDILALALCVASFGAALGIRPDTISAPDTPNSREFQADGKLDRPSSLPGTTLFVRPPVLGARRAAPRHRRARKPEAAPP